MSSAVPRRPLSLNDQTCLRPKRKAGVPVRSSSSIACAPSHGVRAEWSPWPVSKCPAICLPEIPAWSTDRLPVCSDPIFAGRLPVEGPGLRGEVSGRKKLNITATQFAVAGDGARGKQVRGLPDDKTTPRSTRDIVGASERLALAQSFWKRRRQRRPAGMARKGLGSVRRTAKVPLPVSRSWSATVTVAWWREAGGASKVTSA